MNFLNTIPFDTLLWFVHIFFMLHNMEEAPLMVKWSERLPVRIKLLESRRQFIFAVIILTLISFLITYFGLKAMSKHAGHLLILSILMTITFNVFFPHVLLAFWFRMYNPGLVSALFLILPFSIYMFQRALNENLIAQNEFWLLLGLAPLIMIAAIFSSLKLGKRFSNVT
jgi:hypothetical protein